MVGRSAGLLLSGALVLWASACGSAVSPPAPPPRAPAVEAPSPAVETIRATRWVRTSAEYRAISLQAYAAAARTLVRALGDSAWTAVPEQEGAAFRTLPPAVILDVDETVLDNSPFQERMVEAGSDFDAAEWARWVGEARAEAVPGALAFTRRAAQLGVAVFYVTNRNAELEEATRRNLVELGFPVSAVHDAVLCRGEHGWDSDKSARRRQVAEEYRVLLLAGDDLNDFLPAQGRSVGARRRLVEEHRDRWGERWVVLPNPIYGSWVDAAEGSG